tara:strand:+ start:103 stop:786 length:684 start_codon:yes stop_codon:yes gene_type:complete
MANHISIDTVYQRVLALANKEQRGYITPQEFNLFANQAQLEIIEQYLYDINQFSRVPGNDTDYSDMLDLLNDKLNIFKEHITSVALSSGKFTLPNDLLKLGQVIVNNYEADQIEPTTLRLMQNAPLFNEISMNPVYILLDNEIQIYGSDMVEYTYIRKPDVVSWGYVVIGEKAMHDPNNTVNFELHPLEETELVYKILTLAGITLNRQDLSSMGVAMQSAKIQQEKI